MIGTSTIFFFAAFTAFAIAVTTSQDFHVHSQIFHLPFQTNITALNLNCLHHAVTLVTLSTLNSSSLNSLTTTLPFTSFLSFLLVVFSLGLAI